MARFVLASLGLDIELTNLGVEVVDSVGHEVPGVDGLLEGVGDALHRDRPPEPLVSA